MKTQVGYNKGNSFLDFEFRSAATGKYLHSVDTKGLHIGNYMRDKGILDADKLTAKFEENYAQSLKHIKDAAKGNAMGARTPTESLLYVVVSTPDQRTKNAAVINEAENLLKSLGDTARQVEKSKVGVGVVRFEDVWARVKATGRKPGKLNTGAKTVGIALLVAGAILVSTPAEAATSDPKGATPPPGPPTPAPAPRAAPPSAPSAADDIRGQAPSGGPGMFEANALNEKAEEHKTTIFGYSIPQFDAFMKAIEGLAGTDVGPQPGPAPAPTTTTPTQTQIEDKFGKQAQPQVDHLGRSLY
jgi:hypothetical protein